MRHHNKQLRPVIKYAQQLGFTVSTSRRKQHLHFRKPGCRTVFSSSTPGDWRVAKNAMAELRRSAQEETIH